MDLPILIWTAHDRPELKLEPPPDTPLGTD
jgi:hypothetical protein